MDKVALWSLFSGQSLFHDCYILIYRRKMAFE